MEVSSSARVVIIVIFAVYTVILMIWGIYSSKYMKSGGGDFMSKFATGGKSAGAFVTAMTVCAGIAGAGVFMGVPGFIITHGASWLVSCFWNISATLCTLGILGKKTSIVGRRINAQTFTELLMHRFENNRAVAAVSSIIILIFLGAFAVSTITGGGRIFQVLTGLDYRIGLSIFTVLVIVAAIFGGFKGVTTTIMIQGIVMTVSVVVLFCFGIGSAGSIGDAVRAIETIDSGWWDMRIPWPGILSFALLWGFAAFTLPHVCMGSLSYQSTQTMHRAVKIGIIVNLCWLITLNLLTIPAKATFADSLSSADLTIPTLAVTVCPPWVAGLILAGVCAAVQSTLGGMLLTLATTFAQDLYLHAINPKANLEQLKKSTFAGTVVIALVICAFAWNPPALLAQLITYGSGGLLAAFLGTMLLAFYWPRYNKQGAIVNMISGIVIYILMDKGVIPAALKLSMNASIMAGVYGTILGVIVCLLTPKTQFGIIRVWFDKDYDEKYAVCGVSERE